MDVTNVSGGDAPPLRLPRLLGDRLCLDFANTLDPRLGDAARDFLTSYADLVWRGRHTGVLTEDGTRRLLREGAAQPLVAAATFAQAIALRETIYRVFVAIARGGRPAPVDLDALASAHAAALGHARLVPAGAGFVWGWAEDTDALDRVLWPVATSATELLTSGELDRVKECAAAGSCGWLFFDGSKNHSRRWCSMEGCGSRAKMRRQYAKRRDVRSMVRGGAVATR